MSETKEIVLQNINSQRQLGCLSSATRNGSSVPVSNSSSMEEAREKHVVYIYDYQLAKCTENIPHVSSRSRVVHELIKAYGLLQWMEWIPSKPATKDDLLVFHSQDYVQFLFDAEEATTLSRDSRNNVEDKTPEDDRSANNSACSLTNFGISESSYNEENLEEYGLGYDCPLFRNMKEFALRIAGGTITAAEALIKGADVAINWCGGWHHAQRSEASGFCYVNDIVLGIHELQKKFKHILYVDLDAHHGDGVENAFAFSNKVMTLSFHHMELGYFPGTGRLTDVGNGRGKFYSLNVPLKQGVTDDQFMFLFDSIFNSVVGSFSPEALVIQCGADCLARDPLGAFNLTSKSIIHCVRTIAQLSAIPTIFLGGGGYCVPNAARLWTSLTAEILNKRVENDIPDNNPHFLEFGPDFELTISPSLRKNENDVEYISDVINTIQGHLLALRKRKELTMQQ